MKTTLETGKDKDKSNSFSNRDWHDVIRKYILEDMVTESPYAHLKGDQRSLQIVADFNQGRTSIMTSGYNWLFKHRFVKANEFRLVEINGIPELVGFSPISQRREKIFNLNDSSSTIGIFDQSSPIIGQNGHYVVNVPPGQYAKIFDGINARLLGSGQHVIHTSNLPFNAATDLVSQNSPYIKHNDIHVLRVPPGEVAIVKIDNQSYFLESRKDPYIFKTQQFELEKPANPGKIFHDAKSKVLNAGTYIRLLPDIGEIGIINHGGRYKIEEPKSDQTGPMIRDIGNSRFDGFMSTNLQNVEFPSEAARKKHREMGMSQDECNYNCFYTGDSVPVGVRFFVSYRIVAPHKTLETLNLEDISKHIEGVVNADMGNAIKQTSNQNLLSSNLSQPSEGSSQKTSFLHWQDLVKSKLKEDLGEYGIELVRLNIEEAKILNHQIEQQMSQQAITVAEAHARKLALQVNLDIGTQEAQQARTLAKLKQETDGELLALNANYKRTAAAIDAEATSIKNGVELERQRGQAKVLESSPQAMLIAFLNKFVEALQNGNFTSALPLTDLSQMLATFMGKITEATGMQAKTQTLSTSQVGLFAHNEPLVDDNKTVNSMQTMNTF